MGRYEVNEGITVTAPIARVFERLVDHEGMAAWPGVSACVLVKEGAGERNGLGAIRRITAMGTTLHEEIVQFEPPHRVDYTIIRGLPIQHRGTVTLTTDGDDVHLAWHVNIASRIPLVAQVVGRLLQRGLPAALRYLKADAESRR